MTTMQKSEVRKPIGRNDRNAKKKAKQESFLLGVWWLLRKNSSLLYNCFNSFFQLLSLPNSRVSIFVSIQYEFSYKKKKFFLFKKYRTDFMLHKYKWRVTVFMILKLQHVTRKLSHVTQFKYDVLQLLCDVMQFLCNATHITWFFEVVTNKTCNRLL